MLQDRWYKLGGRGDVRVRVAIVSDVPESALVEEMLQFFQSSLRQASIPTLQVQCQNCLRQRFLLSPCIHGNCNPEHC